MTTTIGWARKTRSARWARAMMLAVVLAGPVSAWAAGYNAAGTSAQLLALARDLGLDERRSAALVAGAIVADEPRENTGELVLIAAMVVNAGISEVRDRIRGSRLLDSGEGVVAVGAPLGTPASAASFAELPITSSLLDDLEAVAKTGAGSLQLSDVEVERLSVVRAEYQSAGDRARREALASSLRAALAARLEAYRMAGPRAIAPYARAGDDTDLAELLGRATTALQPLLERAPAMHSALSAGGESSAGALDQQYRWLALDTHGTRTIVLAHRISTFAAEAAFFAERHFYVSSSYDASQTVVGCLAVGDATFVFYSARTFTDRASALGRSLVYLLGRGMIRENTVREFESIRSALEAPPSR